MDHNHDMYLCQVNETLSCGACCGLYNLSDLSRENLEFLLSKRTEDFAAVPRTEDDIFNFQRRNRGGHRLRRPFPQFHHCSFLGFIDEQKRRVGCLLHPAVPGNNGVDYRSLSWYGELACRTYFCPSTNKLTGLCKSILTGIIDNWYDFGLIVTEHALLSAYFQEMEARLGRSIVVVDYTKNIQAVDAFREFVELKSRWPYRRDNAPGPCNFFFENGLYPRPAVFRASPDIPRSSYETILRELESGFSSARELEQAEQLLDALFVKTERALGASSSMAGPYLPS